MVAADEDVVEAVAVDVAGRGEASSHFVIIGAAGDGEALGRGQRGEIDRTEDAFAAEQDESGAAVGAVAVGSGDADEEVVDAVMIEVAGGRGGPAGMVEAGAAVDREAAAGIERG